MKSAVSVFSLVVALNSLGEIAWEGSGPDYSFGTAGNPLRSGTLASPESGMEVNSLSFFPALDAVIKVTGGALNFQTDGGISVAEGGAVEISAPVSAAGDLAISGGMVVTDDLYPQGNAAPVVFSGATVPDVEVVSAQLDTYGKVMTAYPCNEKAEGDEKTVQLQFVDASWMKCVKVRLVNVDGGVAAKVVYRRYVAYGMYLLGVDFDTLALGDPAQDRSKAANYPQVDGCHLKRLTLMRRDGKHGVALGGAVDVADGAKLGIAIDANVRLDGGGTPDGSDTLNADIELEGRLSISNRAHTVLAGEVSGSGDLVLEPWPEASDDRPISFGEQAAGAANLVMHGSSMVLLDNAQVTSITNVSGVWIKKSPDGNAAAARVCRFANNGEKITFQAQMYDGGWVKCAVVEIFNSAAGGVSAKVVETPYYKVASQAAGEEFIGSDTDIYSVKGSWGGSRGNYHLAAITLNTYGLTSRQETILSTDNRQTGGEIVVNAGTRLVFGSKNCVPSNGVVTVLGGGELETRAVVGAGAAQTFSINVAPGGVFRPIAEGSFAYNGPKIKIDGGQLQLNRYDSGKNLDGKVYLNYVTLEGGATVDGRRARIGSNITSLAPFWHIGGGTSRKAVRISSGFVFVGIGYGQSFRMIVDDFADGVDLETCHGELPMLGDGSFAEFDSRLDYRIPVHKQGAGTWLVNAASTNYHAKVFVEDGEMVLGVKDAFPAAELISLSGGRLALANETSQTFTKLTVTKHSSLVLGDGAGAFFKEVATADFGGRLTITGDFSHGSPLRIGESAVLSAQQLGNIRINGRRAIQDERGYLYPYYPGPAIIVR